MSWFCGVFYYRFSEKLSACHHVLVAMQLNLASLLVLMHDHEICMTVSFIFSSLDPFFPHLFCNSSKFKKIYIGNCHNGPFSDHLSDSFCLPLSFFQCLYLCFLLLRNPRWKTPNSQLCFKPLLFDTSTIHHLSSPSYLATFGRLQSIFTTNMLM